MLYQADFSPVTTQTPPRRAVVQVHFADRGMTLAYYNDRFDLQCGDLVYVEGKLAGLLGRVCAINYNFRIRLEDYRRVIARVDTHVRGQFHMAGNHFITFDSNALPLRQAALWFRAPTQGGIYVSGSDSARIALNDLQTLYLSDTTAARGQAYYRESRVRYLCLQSGRGHAFVKGYDAYEVRFCYEDGYVSQLTCDCYSGGNCKHILATLLQLREIIL